MPSISFPANVPGKESNEAVPKTSNIFKGARKMERKRSKEKEGRVSRPIVADVDAAALRVAKNVMVVSFERERRSLFEDRVFSTFRTESIASISRIRCARIHSSYA